MMDGGADVMFRKSFVILQVLLLLLVFVSPGFAEEGFPLTTTNLEIHVMPEYDTSEILILNRITYTNTSDKDFSGEIRFSVPKQTRNNIVVDTINGQDNRAIVGVEDKGEYAEFVWKPTQPIKPNTTYPVHLEYYYSSLPGTGDKKFNFTFVPGYPIQTTNVYLYQPLKSDKFVVQPFAKLLGTDNLGFNVYGVDYNQLKVGENISLDVAYVKNDPSPSVLPPGQTGGSAQQAPAGQVNISAYKKPILILLVVVVAFIAIMVLRANDRRRIEELVQKHREAKGQSAEDDDFEDGDDDDDDRAKELSLEDFEAEKEKLEDMLSRGEIEEEDFVDKLSKLEKKFGIKI